MGIDPKQLASLLHRRTRLSIPENPCRRTTAPGDCQRYVYHQTISATSITTQAGQGKLGDIAVIEKGYMDPPSNIMHVNG